jgi:hypothetical protein
MDDLITNQLEETAEWRRRLTAQHPHERNLTAAALLERLVSDLKALNGSPLHIRAANLLASNEGAAANYFVDVLSQMSRAVGFQSFPKTGRRRPFHDCEISPGK